MHINRINPQTNFKAVNQKYFEWAKKDYKAFDDVSTECLQRLRYDVCLFKEISPQDGIDTLNAIKKHINKPDIFIEEILSNFQYMLRRK